MFTNCPIIPSGDERQSIIPFVQLKMEDEEEDQENLFEVESRVWQKRKKEEKLICGDKGKDEEEEVEKMSGV